MDNYLHTVISYRTEPNNFILLKNPNGILNSFLDVASPETDLYPGIIRENFLRYFFFFAL